MCRCSVGCFGQFRRANKRGFIAIWEILLGNLLGHRQHSCRLTANPSDVSSSRLFFRIGRGDVSISIAV